MTNVFVDSDVILDLLLDRAPHATFAGRLFSYAELGCFSLFTSTVSFLNVHYVASAQVGGRSSRKLIGKLRTLVGLLPVEESHIDAALGGENRDLEDAVQAACATDNRMDFLLTRNIKHYSRSELTVMTPELFLKTLPEPTPE